MYKLFTMMAVLFGLALSNANAAEFKVNQFTNGEKFIAMIGAVEEGDYERFLTAYRQVGYNPVMFMNSPGGNGNEMKKIATFLQSNPLRAVVRNRPQVGCYSACAVIWSSASTQYFHKGAKIGFHIGSLPSDYILELKQDFTGTEEEFLAGMQAYVQKSALEDILYYASMPVKDPIALAGKVAAEGYDSYNFYMLNEADARNIIGAVIRN